MKLKTTAILTLALAFAAPVMAQNVAQAAREYTCKSIREHPTDYSNGGKPFSDQQLDQLAAQANAEYAQEIAVFAAQMRISKEQADTALGQAVHTMRALDHEVPGDDGTWECLSDGSVEDE